MTDSSIRRVRVLRIALAANAGLFVVEAAAGFAFDSLALMADAAHMLSDVVALVVALISQQLLARPASARHTYGLQRAEVLGAFANGALLLVISGGIAFEAARRLDDPLDVAGGGLLIVATIGLAVNLGSALLIARVKGSSLNMHGAYIHMLSDAAGSVGAIVAGLAVVFWDANAVDPLVSLAITGLIVWSAWRLVRESSHVLMEGTPRGMDVGEVEAALASSPGVVSVHHLHLWNLASDVPALSAHVVMEGDMQLHEAQLQGDELRGLLAARFGIDHVTLELECHACEPDSVGEELGDT